jgi:hypothetical protein
MGTDMRQITLTPYEKYTEEFIRIQNILKHQSSKINDLEREIKKSNEELLLSISSIQKMLSSIILK